MVPEFHGGGASGPDALRRQAIDWTLLAAMVAIGLWIAWLYALLQGNWLTGEVRRHVSSDFAAFWAASRLTLQGAAAASYDLVRHGDVIREALGPVTRAHEYLNPPTFLFVVAPLGWLDYVPAKIAWISATLAAFLAMAWRIVPRARTLVLALALPMVFHNAVSGQNGLLTASLIGLALVWLPRRPVLAGIAIGALAIKPQLGILFPIALAAGGHWRAFLAAALAALLICLASLWAFGPEAWTGFFGAFASAGQEVLETGRTGWGKMQSLFGLLRHLGVGPPAAWIIQGLWSAGIVAAIAFVLTRREIGPDLKAATLAVAILLVQPYVFIYDTAILAVALLFLSRAAGEAGFTAFERVRIGLALVVIAAAMLVVANLTFLGTLLVASVVAGRIFAVCRSSASAPLNFPRHAFRITG